MDSAGPFDNGGSSDRYGQARARAAPRGINVGSLRTGLRPMLRQLIFGGAVSLGNIAIHAAAIMVIIRSRGAIHANVPTHPGLRLVGIMIATVSMLMVAHLVEVAIWSIAYSFVGAAPRDSDDLYFAFVNYTTLGYGDVIPVARWRLLGPLTAMNGVLLFGWSTAVIFHVLRASVPADEPHRR
jgi:ion channel